MGRTITTTSVEDMIAQARQQIDNFTSAQVEAHLLDPSVLLVDLREVDEVREQGRIAGAMHVPRGMLEFVADPASSLHHRAFASDRRTILYCGQGALSALAGGTLVQMGWSQVGHLEGGFARWRRDGRAVTGRSPWHQRWTN